MSNENPFGSDNVEISTPDSNPDIKLRELEPETPTAFEPKVPNEEDRVPANVLTELGAVYEIPVQISAVLGRATMKVSQLLKLGRGAVVELDRKVGEAIDIYVNNRLVARGEVVIVEDRLGITMTEIIKSENSAGIN
ncbi:MAG: flagellar motor switch protein FliN [Alphaproteobacteria bacterium]|nr:flagellar motor switch protein FliN [Alphaproteobacteria bacterium]